LIVILSLAALLQSCEKASLPTWDIYDLPYELDLPQGFPEMPIPAGNELTVKRVELGKILFHDKRLSRDNSISCASCHLQELAFAEGLITSIGVDGAIGPRNSPSLANVGYIDSIFWDGGVPTLELQILAPIHNALEMDSHIQDVLDKLGADIEILRLSKIAYDRELDMYVITRAISAFERTLISGNSRFDQYAYQGQENALSPSEFAGWELFNSTETQCASCHSGFNFTNNTFQNIGLYEDYEDAGRERVSLNPADNGKFRVPSLRNVGLTAPYMHDGSLATLEEVIDFFNEGGHMHANKNALVHPLNLDETQKGYLIDFLETLTDEEFIYNSEFQLD
jgi:cytochrome c peroxidase